MKFQLQLDPESDRLFDAFLDHFATLRAPEQAITALVVVTTLLSDQSDQEVEKVFRGVRALLESWRQEQASRVADTLIRKATGGESR